MARAVAHARHDPARLRELLWDAFLPAGVRRRLLAGQAAAFRRFEARSIDGSRSHR